MCIRVRTSYYKPLNFVQLGSFLYYVKIYLKNNIESKILYIIILYSHFKRESITDIILFSYFLKLHGYSSSLKL